mmetsp:Transcript_183/g.787  ORF Transcript_183/g.787 Transcript_183/m.787 type:complete len:247 (-) Transcript_183:1352-2092(-)
MHANECGFRHARSRLDGVGPVTRTSRRARGVGDSTFEGFVERSVAFVFAPFEFKVANHDAVPFAGTGGVEGFVDARHVEHAAKTLIRLKVVPVCHLSESFDGVTVDDESIWCFGDGELLDGLTVGRSRARGRDVRFPLVFNRWERAQSLLNIRYEFLYPLARYGGNAVRNHALCIELFLHAQRSLGSFDVIHLVQGNNFGLVEQGLIEEFQLGTNGFIRLETVFARAVNDVNEHSCTLRVTQKFET